MLLVLRRQKEALEPKYRDHELRYVRPRGGRVLGDAEAAELLSGAFRSAQALAANVGRVLDPRSQELAFGAPGEPGDPARIEHLAQRLIDIYEGFLDWAARLRGAAVPERLERAVEVASSFVDGPTQQFREYIDRTVAEFDRVPALLREERPEPVEITLALVLDVDQALTDEFERELDRVSNEAIVRRDLELATSEESQARRPNLSLPRV